MFLMFTVDSLLNQTELEVVVYTGQLDLIVDTLGQSPQASRSGSIKLSLCCCAVYGVGLKCI